MPELPEVEIAARNLRAWATGRRIDAVEVEPAARRIFRPARPDRFAAELAGHRVRAVRRVGKQLLIELEAELESEPAPPRGRGAPLGLVSHLGMTGKWLRRAPGEPAPSHSRARLALDDGAVLHYRDPRLFGRLRLVPGARFADVPEIAALGPDPLSGELTPARLREALARRRAPVKQVLLDQGVLAGVGNIYAGEALFRARLDPRRPAAGLSAAEVRRLLRALLAAMRESLARQEGPEITYVEEPGAPNPFLVYGREGEPCPRGCGPLRRLVQAGRSTFFCPECQDQDHDG